VNVFTNELLGSNFNRESIFISPPLPPLCPSPTLGPYDLTGNHVWVCPANARAGHSTRNDTNEPSRRRRVIVDARRPTDC
jgi:hypothetical protein